MIWKRVACAFCCQAQPCNSMLSSLPNTMNNRSRESPSSLLGEESRIFLVSGVRVYHANFGSSLEWKCTGLRGTLVFGVDYQPSSLEGQYWFRLLDQEDQQRLIWVYKLFPGFRYCQDKPFFHVFAGKVSITRFLFPSHLTPPRVECGDFSFLMIHKRLFFLNMLPNASL